MQVASAVQWNFRESHQKEKYRNSQIRDQEKRMTKLQQLRPLLVRTCQGCCQNRRLAVGSSGQEKDDDHAAAAVKADDENEAHKKQKTAASLRPMYIPETAQTIDDISEPTTCCMSGCANCVWIEYAEKLSSFLKGSQADVQRAIMDKVQDPNMRAFLSMELRVRKLID